MTVKSEEFKTLMSGVRERIADAKRRCTHSRFINYNGCLSVCVELINILEDAGKAALRGDCVFAYSVAALVLINCAKLASCADDSAGGITDTRGYIDDVLLKACSGVERGSPEAEFIFLHALKDSQNKAFEGWEEFAYSLLLPAAGLAAAANVGKLYAVLDCFNVKLSRDNYSSWHLERDALVRLAAITAVDGEKTAEAFISDNLKYDDIRHAAVEKALDKGDLDGAEKLCLDKINSTESNYHQIRQWYDILFGIYQRSRDKEKQVCLSEHLLIYKYDTKYYGILKQLLTERGEWETQYPILLERLSQKMPYHLYMEILSKEGETRRLLGLLIVYPSEVFIYGEQVSADYPSQIYKLCLDEIYKQASEADSRIKYKKVCANIKKLFEYGGKPEAQDVIAKLKAMYPRRSAMLEELGSLQTRLTRKNK